MAVIDAAGTVVQASWLAGERPPAGRSLSRFLAQNLVTGSSIVVRGALRDVLFPIPDDMAWADWWLAARIAQHAPRSPTSRSRARCTASTGPTCRSARRARRGCGSCAGGWRCSGGSCGGWGSSNP